MSHLYERFILEYYIKEFPDLHAGASWISWALDDGVNTMLPIMKSDTTLSYGDKILIIDAKYYTSATHKHYDKHTIFSHNLYQIFTYVKNKDAGFAEQPHQVSGMLLYARTNETIQPDYDYQMSGNKISVKTLDLNCDFSRIAEQLNQIVATYFGIT